MRNKYIIFPNETVEKPQLLIFSQSVVVENQWLMNPCFW
jgi:hypothetical protein